MASAAELVILLTAKDMATKTLSGFGKELGGMGAAGKVAAVGLAGIAAAGLGLVAGIGSAIGQAMDFEGAMSAVAAVAGGTDADLKRLSDTALQLGQDTTLSGVGATDAARAMRELAAAGLSVDDIVGGAALGALRLASAGGIDVARAAEIAAMALANFGLEGKDTARVADLFAAAANSSAISVDDIAESMKYVGPIANSMGLDIEDVTATIAALGNQGIKGTQAGTALRSMFVSLAKPSKEANKIIKELGLSFFNASGEMKDLGGIAEELKTGMAGLTDKQRAAALATLFGNEALTAATVLYGEGAEGIAKWLGEVTNGATAAEVGAKRNDNLKGSLEALRSSAETALIAFGMGLTPALKDLASGLAGAVSAAIPFLTMLGQGLGRALAAGIGVLQQFGGYVAGVVTAIVGAWQKLQAGEITLAQFIGGMKTLASTVLGDLGILFGRVGELLGPFLARIGEGLRAALPIIGAELVKLGQAFGGWITTTAIPFLQQNLPVWLGAITTWITGTALPALGTAAGQLASALGGWIVTTAIPFLQTNLPAWGGALWGWITTTAVPAVATAAAQLATALTDWVTTSAVPFLQAKLPAWGAALWDWITSTAVPTVVGRVVALANALADWITTQAVPLLNAKLPEWGNAITSFITGTAVPVVTGQVIALANALADWIPNQAVPRVRDYMPLVIDAVVAGVVSGDAATRTPAANWGRNLGDAFGDGLQAAGVAAIRKAIENWKGVFFLGLAAMPTLALSLATPIGDAVAKGLEPGLGAALKNLFEFGAKVFLTFQALTNPAFTFWLNFGIGMMNSLRDGLEGAWGAVQAWVASIPGRIQAAVGDLSNALYQAGVQAVMGLANGILATIPNAVGAAKSLASQVAGALGGALQIRSPSRVTMEMGREIVNGLIEGMDDKQQDAAKKAAEVASSIAKAITDVLGAVRALARFDFGANAVGGEALGWFRHLTESLIATMQEAAAGFEEEGLKAAERFAEAAGKVGGAVKGAVEGLLALGQADWAASSPTGEALGWFRHLAESLLRTLADAATLLGTEALDNAKQVGESLGSIGSAVKSSLEGLQALAEYDFTKGSPTGEAMGWFRHLMESIVLNFAQAATLVGTEGMTKAKEFADAVAKVVASAEAALKLFTTLIEFKDKPAEALVAVWQGLEGALSAMGDLVNRSDALKNGALDYLANMEAAARAVLQAQSIGNGLGGGVPSAPLGVGGGTGGGGGTPGGLGGAPVYNLTIAGDVYDGARFEDRVVSALDTADRRGR